MKTLIKNGLIVDGTGKKGYLSDLLIQDEKIALINENIVGDFDKIIDVKGHVVCPGFIDTHSHTDLKILEDGYQASKLLQGITTEIYGQDGISLAPLPPEYIKDWRKYMSGLDGDSDLIDWNFRNTEGYLNYIEKTGPSTNAAYLVPHGNVRLEVMGLTDRKATDEEIKKMQAVIVREMKAGAIGLSSGLIYIPCAYSNTDEIIQLCKTTAELGGMFVVHQRSEADGILNSMDEIIEIGRKSGIRIHFSHFKACGKKSWACIPDMLKKLDAAQAEGLIVSFDQYPYVAGSTTLSVLLPPWVHVGGITQMLERIKSDEILAKIAEDIAKGSDGWDNFVDFAGWNQIFIVFVQSEANKHLIGKTLEEIAELRGVDPLKATAGILIEENGAAIMVDFYGKEEHVKTFLSRPEQNVCTDGILFGNPHPRAYGAFPRVLGKYVREEKVLTLEEAIFKMTYKPATTFGFKNRGLLVEGAFADIVIFDPDTIIDVGTYENPRQHPKGIEAVIVNGAPIFDEEGMHKLPVGKVLRKEEM